MWGERLRDRWRRRSARRRAIRTQIRAGEALLNRMHRRGAPTHEEIGDWAYGTVEVLRAHATEELATYFAGTLDDQVAHPGSEYNWAAYLAGRLDELKAIDHDLKRWWP